MKRIVDIQSHLRSKIRMTVSGCWEWTGALIKGYGYFSLRVKGKSKSFRVHRLMYEILVGPIPLGLTLDHLCRNRCCVNPEHLEPVTQRINTLRGVGPTAINAKKTRCTHGHEFTPGATYIYKRTGRRVCKICRRRIDNARRHPAQKRGLTILTTAGRDE